VSTSSEISDREEGLTFQPKFDASGLLTCVATDIRSGDVLMVAHMNAESLRRTLESGEAWYFSRSRNALWRKGETSGHTQRVVEMRMDCDQDAVWIKVDQVGAACHTNRRSCFYRVVKNGKGEARLEFDQPVNERNRDPGSAFRVIRAIDYTVIFARDMASMRRFYEDILALRFSRQLSANWVEYQIGANTLVLATPSLTATDAPTPEGSASLQLAFKVSVSEVDQCAGELMRRGVELLSPPTDRPFGHRTLFFRDPDGNLLEVFAEI
jgi:phosphoribosyl-AMP cyclohydrolase